MKLYNKKTSSLLGLFVALTVLFTTSSCYNDGLISLDQHNFHHVLSLSRFVVVQFYDSQCVDCQKSTYEFSKVSQHFSSTDHPVKFFVVDGSSEPALAAHYNVHNFPSIRLFRKGVLSSVEYQAQSSHNPSLRDLTEWILSYVEQPSMKVKSAEEAERIFEGNDIVGLFLGDESSKEFEEFYKMAAQFEDIVFIHSNNEKLREREGLDNNQPGFILFKKFDEGHNAFIGSFKTDALLDFVRVQRYPVAQKFGQDIIQKVFYEGEDAIFLIKRKGSKDTEVEEAFKKAAYELKGDITMTIVDYEDAVEIPISELISVPLNKLLVVDQDDLPAVRLVTPKNKMRRYGFVGSVEKVSKKNLEKFYEEVKNEKVRPLYVSAPIEKNPFDGDVRKVVSKDFEEVVLKSDKNILVLFCNQHYFICRQTELFYGELAKELKESDILLAKIDTSSNEMEVENVKSGLDIKLYLKGRKNEPVDFNGNPEKNALKEFVEKHLTNNQNILDSFNHIQDEK